MIFRRSARDKRQPTAPSLRTAVVFFYLICERALIIIRISKGENYVIAAAPSAMKNLSEMQIKNPEQAAAATPSLPPRTTRLLLRLVRAAQPIPRVELARRIGVNRSTVTDIFKPLLEAGVLRETTLAEDKRARSQGRPPVGIAFQNRAEFFIGVNLGVRRTQIGAIDLSGEILSEIEFETPTEATQALKKIGERIAALVKEFGERKLNVVAVSVPGVANAERDCLLYAPHLGWRNVPIAETLRAAACSKETTIIVENDATAAALFEARLRLKDTSDGVRQNFILLRSGTGIGIGLVLDGEVYRGAEASAGMAGEFGHMTIVAGGKLCVCGNRGCWEQYAAAPAASALYTGERRQIGNQPPPRFVEIVARAEAGEIRAQKTLERVGNYLGIGLGNVITGIGIPHVILSGRLVYGWKFIKPALFETVDKSLAGKLSNWTIECGEPAGSAIGGALEAAIEEYLMRGLFA
jgi:predicted NBD/HSP70 family sugar kinase